MHFETNQPNGSSVGFVEAALRGFSGPGCPFLPAGEADLRPALYAPASAFSDFAAAAAMSLFPGEIDPNLAERLASTAFPSLPSSFSYGEELLVFDLAGGASQSIADYEAAFLSTLLAAAPRSGKNRIVLAAAGSHVAEASALAEAFATLSGATVMDGPTLVLLAARGESFRGIRPFRLARSGGRVFVIGVDAPPEALGELMGLAAGRELAGHPVTYGGPANPARFAARLVLHAATFSQASRGASGDLLCTLPPDDDFGLAAALWDWRFGLPQTGLVFPRADVAAPGDLAPEQVGAGCELVERFAAEQPGALRGLVRTEPVSRAEAEAARAALAAAGGPILDLSSAYSLAAAGKALDSGLRGHARVILGRVADPAWDLGSPFADAQNAISADATILPRLDALEAAIARLLPRIG